MFSGRWPRVLLVTVVLLAAGLWLSRAVWIHALVSELPILVRVFERDEHGNVTRQIEVRDRTFLVRTDELLQGYRKSKPAGRPPQGHHFRLEFISPGEHHARTIYVADEGDKEFWLADQDRHLVPGSFRLLVECLAIQRAFELVHHPQEDEREAGRKLLIERGDHFFDIAFESCRRQSQYARRQAIRHVQELVAWQTPKAARRSGGYPNFGRSRELIAGPFPAEHPRIGEVRQFALHLIDEDHMARDATELLSLVADESVISELTRRLKASTNWSRSGELMIALQACLGLPPEFEKRGVCGNSSAAELRQHANSEERRTQEAAKKLLDWLRQWESESPDRRQSMVLNAWRPHFDQIYPGYSYHLEDQAQRCQNLLRRGKEMLPAIKAIQATNTSLQHRAGLEFANAYWTGECDRALIEELFRSGRTSQFFACDIIAAAQDPSWKVEVASLIGNDVPGDPESGRLEIKASETLVICHGIDAIPLLQASGTIGRGNDVARAALMHFEVPGGGY